MLSPGGDGWALSPVFWHGCWPGHDSPGLLNSNPTPLHRCGFHISLSSMQFAKNMPDAAWCSIKPGFFFFYSPLAQYSGGSLNTWTVLFRTGAIPGFISVPGSISCMQPFPIQPYFRQLWEHETWCTCFHGFDRDSIGLSRLNAFIQKCWPFRHLSYPASAWCTSACDPITFSPCYGSRHWSSLSHFRLWPEKSIFSQDWLPVIGAQWYHPP